MVNPNAIIKTNRRSISITISKKGEVVVHAPKRLSMEKIMAFVTDKQSWIVRKQNEILTKLNQNADIIEYKTFIFCGKKYPLNQLTGVKKIELTDNALLAPPISNKTELLNIIAKWYVQVAKELLSERIEYFANLMQLDYHSLTITNSKNRWGSCDSKSNIKLNFRVIMLPHKIIDYIVIHELAHLIELNHSKKFYKIIECVMPNYRVQQKQLKDSFFLLQVF